jgi:hypothetical protein
MRLLLDRVDLEVVVELMLALAEEAEVVVDHHLSLCLEPFQLLEMRN